MKAAFALVLIVIASMAAAPGCGGSGESWSDPLSAAGDAGLSSGERIEAIGLASEQYADDEQESARFREAMKSIAWSRTERPQVRMRAIRALAEQDEQDTVRMLSLMLPTETQWPVIRGVSSLAAERGWTALTPGLVRSWARVVPEPPDANRPERRAIAALHPDSRPEDVVFEVFRDPQVGALFREETRRDAWTLLARIDDRGERTKALLADADLGADDPVLRSLQLAARELHVAPRTTPQLEWLQSLDAPERRPVRRRWAELAGALDDEQRNGLELRHLSAIHWAADHEPGWLDASRQDLFARCESLLKGRDRVRRISGYPDRMAAPRQTLSESADALVWGDLLMILLADRAVRNEAVLRDIFEYAAADRRDTTTEYGGVIDRADSSGEASEDRSQTESAAPGFRVALHEPRPTQRGNDHRFIAPPAMVEARTTTLFDFHLHVQSVNNRDYAGPSRGDLEYAREHGRSCIVFTSISGRTLNVDYYQPNGTIIDLGFVRRP